MPPTPVRARALRTLTDALRTLVGALRILNDASRAPRAKVGGTSGASQYSASKLNGEGLHELLVNLSESFDVLKLIFDIVLVRMCGPQHKWDSTRQWA